MKVTAIYARVSTKRQEHEGTIESQVAALLAYAEKEGYSISPKHRFLDQGVSGATLTRTGLDRLRDAVYMRNFQYLLMLDIGRLARTLGLQLLLLNEFRQAGVKVIFLNSPPMGETPIDTLLFSISGAFAEYERSKIVERMRRGWLYKLKNKERVPQPAPYGYRYVSAQARQNSSWQRVSGKAQIVKQIFQWYTDDGLTVRQIVQRLNEAQHAAPRGGLWRHSTIRAILGNQSYTGQGYYNRRTKEQGTEGTLKRSGRGRIRYPRLKPRPKEEWIPFSVPAIITHEQWAAAQKIMKQNQKRAQRNSKRRYLLSSLLVCDVCQHTMHGATYRNRSYYRCAYGGKKRDEGIPEHSMVVDSEIVETAVWDALRHLLKEPDHIAEAWNDYKATEDVGESERLKKRIEQLNVQRERLLDAYQEGYISRTELAMRQNPLLQELEQSKGRLQDAQTWESVDISVDEFTQQIELALDTADCDLQRNVIRLLIERIIVSDEALVIEHLVPTTEAVSRLRPQRQDVKT